MAARSPRDDLVEEATEIVVARRLSQALVLRLLFGKKERLHGANVRELERAEVRR